MSNRGVSTYGSLFSLRAQERKEHTLKVSKTDTLGERAENRTPISAEAAEELLAVVKLWFSSKATHAEVARRGRAAIALAEGKS